jgi:deoxycytidine triphosphate deaminase
VSVLTKAGIEQRLSPGGSGRHEIFKIGTWTEGGLRNSAYDLRIACEFLITPSGRHYWPSGPEGYTERKAPFMLKPGDVAFVSSVEELCMPLDLVGNIGPQFRRTLDGIMVMGGFLVDPGYDGRLHFQLVNIGSKDFEIVPGSTSIAAIQFLPLVGGKVQDDSRVPQNDTLLESLFHAEVKDDELPPMAFFGVAHEAETLRSDLERLKADLEVTKKSTDNLVVFGLVLLCITLLGVAAAAVISQLAAQ